MTLLGLTLPTCKMKAVRQSHSQNLFLAVPVGNDLFPGLSCNSTDWVKVIAVYLSYYQNNNKITAVPSCSQTQKSAKIEVLSQPLPSLNRSPKKDVMTDKDYKRLPSHPKKCPAC